MSHLAKKLKLHAAEAGGVWNSDHVTPSEKVEAPRG